VHLARAHVAWGAGNHTELTRSRVMHTRWPVGWCQGMRLEPPSIRASHYEDWAPNTASARGVRITGPLKRPICQNGGSSPGAFTGTSSNWQATSMRGVSPLATFVPCDEAPALRQHRPPVVCNPGAPSRRRRSPPARLARRLERFQACALRNHPTLQVSPESNKQATGQGHDANAPHALASQGKAGIEPDAEGGVGLIT
jgi:hypothetical protein